VVNHEPNGEELDLALRVCEMYYNEGKTQEQIAKEINVSRPRVSRILTFAKNAGLVTITIRDPRSGLEQLANSLKTKYGLKDARVVATSSDPEVLKRRIGYSASQLLEECVDAAPNQVLGIGRGSTVYHTVQALPSSNKARPLTVVPMVGGIGLYNPAFQVNEMARLAAERLGGDCIYFHAPYFVTTPEIKKAFLQDETIAQCISYWDRLDIALVGIGAISFQDPLFTARVKNAQARSGRRIVADLCGRFLDKEGRVVREEPDVLLSIEMESLRKAKRVIAVAGGRGKEDSVKTAVIGGWVDVLVTDQWVAEAMCR